MSTTDTPQPHDLRSQLEAATRGRFEIDRELGRGGMGAVFLARQVNLDRRVAIKVLFPHQASDAGLRERFLREARTQSRFDHPNIVPIIDVAEEGGLSFFVMAFVDGPTLRARMAESPRMEPFVVVRLLREVGEALAYAHRVGVIHRDVKPENILIDPAGGRAMITDFGIARIGDASQVSLTATFTRIGSPRYMAPEQAEGVTDLDGRSDQYALALIGYEMLAGRPAFDAGNPAELLYKHRYEEADSLDLLRPDVPATLRAAIHRGMRKSREERFPTLDAFVEALASPVPTTVPRAARKADRMMRLLLVASGVFLAVVVLAVVLRPRSVPPKPKPLEAQVSVPVDSTSRVDSRGARGGRAPVARLGAPSEAKVGEAILFDAGMSEDAEDGAYGLEVRWDFEGDGRFDTPWSGQKRAEHSYPRSGTQNVTLEVRDSGGQVHSATRAIQIADLVTAPVPHLETTPARGPRGTEFRFDASGSSDDYDMAEMLEVRWDWDADGAFDTDWSREKRAAHVFDGHGAKRVRLEVRDREGRVGTATGSVIVEAPTDPNELIALLLDDFRVAAEQEDFLSLGRKVYHGDVPADDRELLKRIFDKAEQVSVDPPRPKLAIGREEGTMEARLRLRFQLSASGEPGDLKLRLVFAPAGKTDWKLRRIERD